MNLTDGLDHLSFWHAWIDHGVGESQILNARLSLAVPKDCNDVKYVLKVCVYSKIVISC
uniref:Uncharacterized protein n=1 Tax=Musa acuminata subsp. malaccensis TaxID=214687 RepID=A0A804JNX0_MUSAM